MSTERLERDFFARDPREVAPELLGKGIHHRDLAARIVEVEAYVGAEDPASHAYKGETPRTAVMFGPPGHLYVYFTYGMHWMFNVVTGEADVANAILIRALEPLEGIEIMMERRMRPLPELTNGPAKLAQAMGIDKQLNGASLYERDSVIWLEAGDEVGDDQVARGPRIGLGKTPEPWKSVPWRFWIDGNSWVSK